MYNRKNRLFIWKMLIWSLLFRKKEIRLLNYCNIKLFDINYCKYSETYRIIKKFPLENNCN